jgi:hypothetical protein
MKYTLELQIKLKKIKKIIQLNKKIYETFNLKEDAVNWAKDTEIKFIWSLKKKEAYCMMEIKL